RAPLERGVAWVRETLAELDVSEQIRTRVTEGMDKTQREFLLRQQMQAIREELGEAGDGDDAVAESRTKLHALAEQGALADDVRTTIEREVDRFERTSEQSPEHGWIRPCLGTVFELPWGTRSDESLDVRNARAILDADHNGLDD